MVVHVFFEKYASQQKSKKPKVVGVAGVGLTSLPEGLFSGLTSLTSINMERCSDLTSLPGGLFSGLTSLKELDMRGCPNLKLPAGLVEELKAKGVEVKGM